MWMNVTFNWTLGKVNPANLLSLFPYIRTLHSLSQQQLPFSCSSSSSRHSLMFLSRSPSIYLDSPRSCCVVTPHYCHRSRTPHASPFVPVVPAKPVLLLCVAVCLHHASSLLLCVEPSSSFSINLLQLAVVKLVAGLSAFVRRSPSVESRRSSRPAVQTHCRNYAVDATAQHTNWTIHASSSERLASPRSNPSIHHKVEVNPNIFITSKSCFELIHEFGNYSL
jgi:hypothetical protein